MTKKIKIELSNDEAIVLFERLAQLDETVALPAEDHAEELVFWRIQAQLEKKLVDPFRDDFKDRIADAKERITKEEQEETEPDFAPYQQSAADCRPVKIHVRRKNDR